MGRKSLVLDHVCRGDGCLSMQARIEFCAGVARKDYCDNLKIKNTLAGGDGSVLFEWRLVDWRI
ncbi:hypothetical protein BSN85_38520 [Bradyrhizobium brasilense]|nr:hypothetical protein BSN85_38520 [Bradyrhizobium brasilense]